MQNSNHQQIIIYNFLHFHTLMIIHDSGVGGLSWGGEIAKLLLLNVDTFSREKENRWKILNKFFTIQYFLVKNVFHESQQNWHRSVIIRCHLAEGLLDNSRSKWFIFSWAKNRNISYSLIVAISIADENIPNTFLIFPISFDGSNFKWHIYALRHW